MCCVVLKLAIKFLFREKMMTQVRILFKEMMIRFVFWLTVKVLMYFLKSKAL